MTSRNTSSPSRTTSPKTAVPKTEEFFNRELSWLSFNARVLEEAANPINLLLERLKFLSIFANNLDEFFMIYVPGMRARLDESATNGAHEVAFTSRLKAIREKLLPMLERQATIFTEIMHELEAYGVRLRHYADLTDAQKSKLEAYFEAEVFPVLTPLAVDPGHPFPYISNLSLSLAVKVYDPILHTNHFARVKVPGSRVLPRFVPLETEGDGAKWQFVLLEEVITAHISWLFPGMEAQAVYPFRITRNSDLELTEEPNGDLLEMIEEQLSQRRFGEVERIELTAEMPAEIRDTIVRELETAEQEEVYAIRTVLNMVDFFALAALDIPELHDPPHHPAVPLRLRGVTDIFAEIRKGDILLHHPYETFSSVTDFIVAAANDPQVLAIKHTLYRTSGDSPILQALIDAADEGKQVACLVELKARFDEENNITWAKQLEKYGVHVVYGLLGLKTHCKVTLVVRREEDGLRRYLHVGTGNYNPKTSAIYTDIGVLTCEPEMGADATDLFNYLTGYARRHAYRKFLVAPVTLRSEIHRLIVQETERHSPETPGRIVAKMNSLVDPPLIRALYAASQKGVQIDLIVRGMCCLRPGVPGLSENIRVISVIGRFLEHSRIFAFGEGERQEVFFGSADWMSRNLDRRVEVVAPLTDPELRSEITENLLPIILNDNCQAWDLLSDGTYKRRKPAPDEPRRSSQQMLVERYR
ncbi:MAG: polyphosphate kinase 1 [Chthonomonadaceae bacterium]|nr:polyphosphate kinase 1 [Chthonomonadaceae bacterium]